jgi:tRNA dimethylallyltransferase
MKTTQRPEFQNVSILTGPTGSGKSRLALTLAERLGAEIVCMDSMTLYRGMDVGTAKPDAADRRRVPHHLLDVLDPWESASVAWWLEQAASCCRDIEARGRRALFVGGTPLYLKTLLCGLFDGPPADPDVRRRLEAEATAQGTAALHARLAVVDPALAARVHPNDLRRMIRALEVFELTGRPLSAWQTQWPARGEGQEAKVEGPEARNEGSRLSFLVPHIAPLVSGFSPLASRLSPFAWLNCPRQELFARIDRRVDDMIAAGFVDEVRRLSQLGRPLSRTARQAAGYSEILAYLDGQIDLDVAVVRIKLRTRQLAKRQITWFRHLPGCVPMTEAEVLSQFGGT